MNVSASGAVESELLHTYSRVDPLDVLVLCVRLAVLVAVTLTVPVVLFPVRILRAGQGLGSSGYYYIFLWFFLFHMKLNYFTTKKVLSDLRRVLKQEKGSQFEMEDTRFGLAHWSGFLFPMEWYLQLL